MKKKTIAAILLGMTLTTAPPATVDAAPICPWQQKILDITAKRPESMADEPVGGTSATDKKEKTHSVDKAVQYKYAEEGRTLTKRGGVFYGPSGKECYYNLPMNGVIMNARKADINDRYWIRRDGVKMYGRYVIVAADLNVHPRGSIIPTSLGDGIVLDTGSFIKNSSTALDIATAW